MRSLEELTGQRLTEYKPLTCLLCRYRDAPAVFYQLAPNDKQTGWGCAAGMPPDFPAQYPRVIYDFDMQANAERKSSGTLIVYTFCDTAGTDPETLNPLIRECLKDVLIKPDGGFPYCFAWAQTEPFEIPGLDQGATNRRVIGQEIRFDIIEYPPQESTNPDPIAALNNFLLDYYPEAVMVGVTPMEAFTEASAEKPVIYCRLQSAETESISNTVVWMNARIAIHIICPDPEMRLKLTADIQNRITWCAKMRMLDASIMKPIRISLNNMSDYLKEGQIDGTFYYGVMRWMSEPHKLRTANLRLDLNAYIVDYQRQ